MVTSSIRLRTYMPALVAVILLLLQIFVPAPPIMFALITVGSVLAISYVWARQTARNVTIQRRRRYGWAQVGDIIEERFVMRNDSWLPVLWAEIRDFSDLPGYAASRAIGLAARSSARWTTEGICERRGVYTLGPLEIIMGDPFDLFEIKLAHNYKESFVVYPPIAALPTLLQPRGMVRGAARTNTRSLDVTTNASSVREYTPGDALHRIHWRTTARRSSPTQEQIFVKEYDLEPSGDVWLVLDLDAHVHAGEGTESTEEYAVILAASLASQMLRTNHAVGLVTYAQEPTIIRPRRGHDQLWEVLRVLAAAHAVGDTPLGQVLQQVDPLIGHGMSVTMITPAASPEWIKGLTALLRRGIYSTALLLDAASFGGDGDMRGLLGALADMGVPGHIVGKGFKFQLLTQRRQQRPRYRVLGTGRVVIESPGDQTHAKWVPVGRDEG